MTITDPEGEIERGALLDTVQELRDAGAEVIQVGPVRVVAQTCFTDGDDRPAPPAWRWSALPSHRHR